MSNLTVLALFTLCFCLSHNAFAVTPSQVAYYWTSKKFPNCEPLGDFVATRANQKKLRELADTDCNSIPDAPKNCLAAADAILSEKFDERAIQLGCKPSKTPIVAVEPEASKKVTMLAACNKTSMMGPKTVATNKGSMLVCELRTKCMAGFSIYGKDFEEGDYRLTCTVAAGTMCSNVKAEGCSNPTIQKQGLLWNDDVVILNEANGVQ